MVLTSLYLSTVAASGVLKLAVRQNVKKGLKKEGYIFVEQDLKEKVKDSLNPHNIFWSYWPLLNVCAAVAEVLDKESTYTLLREQWAKEGRILKRYDNNTFVGYENSSMTSVEKIDMLQTKRDELLCAGQKSSDNVLMKK